jgi:hypothetical protein
MRRFAKASLSLLLAAVVTACVNEHEMRKRDIQHFMQTATGEYRNEAGDRLVLVPVYARYMFTQQGQWRNLLQQPELLSALQPNDVRPAGTCDLHLAEDMNSISYSCGGSPPTSYQRVQHAAPE